METNIIAGTLLVTVGGIFSGTFALPFKYNTHWSWENNWTLYSFFALLIAPWLFAFFTIPELFSVYAATPGNLLLVGFFGLIWGVGAILFGLGINALGISLSLPIMQGLINSVGTLMPIILNDPSELLTPVGLKIILGVSIIIIGIVLVSVAGSNKESKPTKATNKAFQKGLIICILAGILGPMINFAFVYGAPLQQKAVELGASATFSSNAIWSIALTGGFFANIIYCFYLLKKNKSWKKYMNTKSLNWILGSLAGVIWYLSIMFYGFGGNQLGPLGASIGWAIMQSTAILAGNLAGIITGEWRGASRKSLRIMFSGISFLIVGIIIIAFQ